MFSREKMKNYKHAVKKLQDCAKKLAEIEKDDDKIYLLK